MKHVRFLASAVLLVVPLALYAQLAGTAGAAAVAASGTQHLQQHTSAARATMPAGTASPADDAHHGVCTYAYDQAYGDCTGTHQATEPSLSDVGGGGGGAGGR